MVKIHKVKITVLKRFSPSDVFSASPVTHAAPVGACEIFKNGQKFIVEDLKMPKGFCTSAWVSIYGNVRLLGFGGNLPWFKEKGVAVNCCIDGLRPVIFKLERILIVSVRPDVRLLLPPGLASILLSDRVAIVYARATRKFGEFSISHVDIHGNFPTGMGSPITAAPAGSQTQSK